MRYFTWKLEIVSNILWMVVDMRYCTKLQSLQYQQKLMMLPWENDKILISDSICSPPSPSFPIFFSWVLPLQVVRQCFKLSSYAISKKTNEPNLKKVTKKPNFGPDFGPNLDSQIFLQDLPLLVVRQCSKVSFYAIFKKTNEPNLRKWQKNTTLDLTLTCLAQIWAPKFFLVVFSSTSS